MAKQVDLSRKIDVRRKCPNDKKVFGQKIKNVRDVRRMSEVVGHKKTLTFQVLQYLVRSV